MQQSILKISKAKLRKYLSAQRYKHSVSVALEAQKIALLCKADPDKAYLAGLLHDLAKDLSDKELLKIARKNKIKLTKINLAKTGTLHSTIGAVLARKIGIKDKTILAAIRNHTFGAARMSKIEKIIFIADYIEPSRTSGGAKDIRKAFYKKHDLNAAVVSKAKYMLKYARKNGWLIHPGLIQAAKLKQ